jgi:hypothetical protein
VSATARTADHPALQLLRKEGLAALTTNGAV